MLVPLCPFDQLTVQPEHTLEAVKVTFSPGQRFVGPLAAILGVDGAEHPNWVTSIVSTVPSQPVTIRLAVRVAVEELTLKFTWICALEFPDKGVTVSQEGTPEMVQLQFATRSNEFELAPDPEKSWFTLTDICGVEQV